jgi:hypothetical protein
MRITIDVADLDLQEAAAALLRDGMNEREVADVVRQRLGVGALTELAKLAHDLGYRRRAVQEHKGLSSYPIEVGDSITIYTQGMPTFRGLVVAERDGKLWAEVQGAQGTLSFSKGRVRTNTWGYYILGGDAHIESRPL